MDQRSERQGGIGDAAGHDNVGALVERLRDRECAEIEVGRDDIGRAAQERAVDLARGKFARRQEARDIVALDHRNTRAPETRLAGQRKDALACGARIGSAEVADDPDLLAQANSEHRRNEAFERGTISAVRIAPPLKLCQRERALGQRLEHQKARTVALRQRFDHGTGSVGAIAGKSCAGANEYGSIHR